ncbi:hypothetical protein C8R46DRAFT_1231229 [Mycena filopes]|nr:hypothetical protein C8R46DRAFT_1231229 [Mycena filopes]
MPVFASLPHLSASLVSHIGQHAHLARAARGQMTSARSSAGDRRVSSPSGVADHYPPTPIPSPLSLPSFLSLSLPSHANDKRQMLTSQINRNRHTRHLDFAASTALENLPVSLRGFATGVLQRLAALKISLELVPTVPTVPVGSFF